MAVYDSMKTILMDQTIRLGQGHWLEAWWVLVTHGGALACLLATGLEAWFAGLLATLLCVDAWYTGRRYGLRVHRLSVVGVHVRQTRIVGLHLHNGCYLHATACARLMRLGLLDVVSVRVNDERSGVCVIVDAHHCVAAWERHLLRLATRHIGGGHANAR
jgi:hypothetical protein